MKRGVLVKFENQYQQVIKAVRIPEEDLPERMSVPPRGVVFVSVSFCDAIAEGEGEERQTEGPRPWR